MNLKLREELIAAGLSFRTAALLDERALVRSVEELCAREWGDERCGLYGELRTTQGFGVRRIAEIYALRTRAGDCNAE